MQEITKVNNTIPANNIFVLRLSPAKENKIYPLQILEYLRSFKA